MARVNRFRLLLVLATVSLVASVPAAALAECLGDGGGGGSYVWPEYPTGGGGGSTGGGSTGGGTGGGTTIDESRCSTLPLQHEGPEEDCRGWEGQITTWEAWESPASTETTESAKWQDLMGHDPILFVHGFMGNRDTFSKMIERFKNAGWPSGRLFNWTYDWKQSNITIASLIQAKVNALRTRTGASQVDIITHSMGGLSSRYYLKFLGGTTYVEDWVSLGGPNHGTKIANGCNWTSCQQMRAGSSFLTTLNAGDETPGATNYLAYRSSCDWVIRPSSSVYLTGAANLPTSDPNATTYPCPGHSGLHKDAAVFNDVLYFVEY
jgi:triacylglycerol lipase